MTWRGEDDPAIRVLLAAVALHIEALDPGSSHAAPLRQQWLHIATRVAPVRTRWKRVVGPVSALIAMLLQAQWRPRAADLWLDPGGVPWRLSFGMDPRQLQQALAATVEQQLLSEAARHRAGKGLEHGVAWAPVRAAIRQTQAPPSSAG